MRGRSLLLALLSAFALGGLTLFLVPATAHAAPIRMEGGYERVMTQDADFLYVLEGRKLYKIEKGTLKTTVQGALP